MTIRHLWFRARNRPTTHTRHLIVIGALIGLFSVTARGQAPLTEIVPVQFTEHDLLEYNQWLDDLDRTLEQQVRLMSRLLNQVPTSLQPEVELAIRSARDGRQIIAKRRQHRQMQPAVSTETTLHRRPDPIPVSTSTANRASSKTSAARFDRAAVGTRPSTRSPATPISATPGELRSRLRMQKAQTRLKNLLPQMSPATEAVSRAVQSIPTP